MKGNLNCFSISNHPLSFSPPISRNMKILKIFTICTLVIARLIRANAIIISPPNESQIPIYNNYTKNLDILFAFPNIYIIPLIMNMKIVSHNSNSTVRLISL